MRCATPAVETVIAALRYADTPRLTLLTGRRGAGKTHWCLAVWEAARRARLGVAGVISPPVYAAGAKIAIDVLDAATGARRRLAERLPPGLEGTAGLGWRFDPAALAWGDALLKNIPACDLLFVDELGPLEFHGQGGFSHGFSAIAARRYRLALVVVRPELIAAALSNWPWVTHIYDRGLP
jgi:nucleoside-triphosphatase THEP1